MAVTKMKENKNTDQSKSYLPAKGDVGYFDTRDGTVLRVGLFPAVNSRKATILLVGGHREFIEKQTEFIEDLQKRGFDVYAYDHRGQGGSSRKLENQIKSHNPDFGLIVKDMHEIVARMVKPETLETPFYLIAHSMGTQFAMRYLHDHQNIFDCAILLSPFTNFNIGGKIFTFLTKLYAFLANLVGFSDFFAPGQARNRDMIDQERAFTQLTHDRVRFNWSQDALTTKPELFIGGVTFGWIKGVIKSMNLIRSPGYVEKIETPVLAVLAGDETVVDNEMTLSLLARMKNAEYQIIDGARHEIYREIDEYRNPLLAKIDAFLETH